MCFHCLCESYEQAPTTDHELFVSVADMRVFVDQLLERGTTFTGLEGRSPNTVTITFDDGYQNNFLFRELSQLYQIPYLLFISSHYILSGNGYPWFTTQGTSYSQMHEFDYYAKFEKLGAVKGSAHEDEPARPMTTARPMSPARPMTIEELKHFSQDPLVELGCHGHYHQPLSEDFEKYLEPERDRCLSALDEHLGIKPRYFSLANGMYTKGVVRELLKTFDRVLTIDGRPFRAKDNVIHRISLLNPNLGGPLIDQLDRHLSTARQLKRAFRTYRRLRL